MRVHDVHDRLERLWKNAELHLESQFDSMLEFLVNYSAGEEDTESFNYILDNPPSRELDDPRKLWRNCLSFRDNMYDAHDNYPKNRMEENILPILIEIILSENRLLLLGNYGDKIINPNTECLETERQIRRWVLVFEYKAANIIEDNATKASLYRAHIRNARYLGSKTDIYLQHGIIALCGEIISSLEANLPISNEDLKGNLLEIKKIIRLANKKRVHLPKPSVFALYKSLEGVGSTYASDAFDFFSSINLDYTTSKREYLKNQRNS